MNFNVNRVKIFVTVPEENLKEVMDAVCNAGAWVIGNYDYCTIYTKSVGTSRPNDKAHPYIGQTNKIEYINEEKLEFVCDVDKVKHVISELRRVHPYEEPAIDIVPLIDESDFK